MVHNLAIIYKIGNQYHVRPVEPLELLVGRAFAKKSDIKEGLVIRNMDEAILKKTILLMMERDALENMIFEHTYQKRILKRFNELSKNQPTVIKIIGMEGEIMPSTIGNYTGMNKSSLTRMIDDLEKKRMVFRKNDPEDRRKVLVSLTEKGLECYNYFNEILDEILKDADEKDVNEYLQSLETTVRILNKIDRRWI